MFIVPVKGVYAFHLMVHKTAVTDNFLTVHIMQDSSTIAGAHVNDVISHGTGCSSVLVELDQFNRVYAQVFHGPLQSSNWSGAGSIQFTGYLLYTLA